MLPLAGRRILVTRASHQASELAERLRELGATAILIPTIEIAPPASYAGLDDALAQLQSVEPVFDVVAFTSANAVRAFQHRAEALGVNVARAPKRIAAVGPATARALEAIGLHVDIVPPAYTAESLANTLAPEAAGRRILLVLAGDAPPTLRAALEKAGARVTVAAAYTNRVPEGSRAALTALFAQPASYPDAITFTSASTVVNLLALMEGAGLALPSEIIRASIGPVTSRALRDYGLAPHIEAPEATIPALAAALAGHFSGR
jgi:uroporphyrinogen-III synthase